MRHDPNGDAMRMDYAVYSGALQCLSHVQMTGSGEDNECPQLLADQEPLVTE